LTRINKKAKAKGLTRPVDIARAEAKAIRELSGDRPLRLHIVGDCKTPKAAEIVARACHEYSRKSRQKVWTYTHTWKTIPRDKWGDISVLASCESIRDAKYAMSRGYAASIVRIKPFDKSFNYEGLRMVPCLEMVNGTQCDRCRICWHDNNLRKNKHVICFFVHGTGIDKARSAVYKCEHQELSDGRNSSRAFRGKLETGDF
jgi:hypothetical protein